MSFIQKIRLFFCCVIGLAIFLGQLEAQDAASLQNNSFNFSDKAETLLTINERGFYALKVISQVGVKISLFDRMKGLVAENGEAGRADGRLDLLLEKGLYKVVLSSLKYREIKAELKVLPFEEKNVGSKLTELPYLKEGDFITTTLADLEKRSFWIYQPQRQEVRFEVLGRSLASCTIWQNGEWLISARPQLTIYEPVKGQPMVYGEFYGVLEPGYYLVVFKGGQMLAWSNETKETPLFIRCGLDYLGKNGMHQIKISPLGREVFLIDGEADYFECMRQELKDTRLTIATYEPSQSRFNIKNRYSCEITKDSKEAFCSLTSSSIKEKRWLIIESSPGDVITINFFKKQDYYYMPVADINKNYWISSLVSLKAFNMLDLTAIVYTQKEKQFSMLKEKLPHLNSKQPLVRKINLLSKDNLFVYVDEAGTYQIEETKAEGARANYSFIILEDWLANRNIPAAKPAGSSWDLKKGYYLLRLSPTTLGILHFAVFKAGAARPQDLFDKLSSRPEFAFSWPFVSIPAKASYFLLSNIRDNLAFGFDIRELPLTLNEPLNFYCLPGESLEIPVKVATDSVITFEAEQCSLWLKGLRLSSGASLSSGTQTLVLKNESSDIKYIKLHLKPKIISSPQPPLVLKNPEQIYPLCEEGKPYFTNIEKGQTISLLVKVKEPGFYKLETTGRLALSLYVRSPIFPELFKAVENGPGRNAFIQAYLLPGYYLVDMAAALNSQGRAGLVLSRTVMRNEGLLTLGQFSRKTVEPDSGLCYQFIISEEGEYSLASYGLGLEFDSRLEDELGFPLVAKANKYFNVALKPGRWTYYSFPVSFSSRRLTLLEKVRGIEEIKQTFKEYQLRLNQPQIHIWEETPDRKPDIFYLNIPAPLTVSFSLTPGVRASLKATESFQEFELLGGNETTLKLQAGNYQIRLWAQEMQNRLTYTIAAKTEMLAPGLSLEFTNFPTEIIVSAAGNSMFEIASFGLCDLKASLWDERGTILLAQNDDRPDDWNFCITQRLADGFYRLRLEKAGYVTGSARVFMIARPETSLETKQLPLTIDRKIAKEIIKTDFTTTQEGILYIKNQAKLKTSISLYRGSNLLAEGEDYLYLPVLKNNNYTLYLWHKEDGIQQVKVDVSLNVPAQLTLGETPAVINCPPFLAINNSLGLSYRFYDPSGNLLFSPGPELPCQVVTSYPLNTLGKTGYLVVTTGKNLTELRVEPLVLSEGRKESMILEKASHVFSCNLKEDKLYLVQAESVATVVGIMLDQRQSFKTDKFSWSSLDYVFFKSYCLIAQAGTYLGKVWATGKVTSERVELSLKAFPLTASFNLVTGETKTVKLKAGQGIKINLANSPQELRLLLSKGCFASVWKNGKGEAMAVAEQENRELVWSVNGGVLGLVNNSAQDAIVSIEVRTQSGIKRFNLGLEGFEAVFSQRGSVSFNVSKLPEGSQLFLFGNVDVARLKATDGILYQASLAKERRDCFSIAAQEGELIVEHGPGLLKVVAARSQELESVLALKKTGLKVRPLTGQAPISESPELWSFSLEKDGFVQFDLSVPGIVTIYREDRPLAVELATSIVRYLAKGSYELVVRTFSGSMAKGTIQFKKLNSLSINEQSEHILGEGDSAVFSFTVKTESLVGCGIKNEADGLMAFLYDSQANLVASGPLIFTNLKSGSYYLLIRAQGISKPIVFTPLVYGHEGSLTDIPKEVLDRFIK